MFKNGTNIDKTSEGKNCQHSAKELFEEIEIDDSLKKNKFANIYCWN